MQVSVPLAEPLTGGGNLATVCERALAWTHDALCAAALDDAATSSPLMSRTIAECLPRLYHNCARLPHAHNEQRHFFDTISFT